jgi:hypothetical protein
MAVVSFKLLSWSSSSQCRTGAFNFNLLPRIGPLAKTPPLSAQHLTISKFDRETCR